MNKTVSHNKAVLSEASFELLKNCNKTMFSKLEAPEVYNAVIEGASCILQDSKITLLLIINPDRQQLLLKQWKGVFHNDIKESSISTDELNSSLSSRQIIYNPLDNPRFIYREVLERKNICCRLSLPLKIQDLIVGVVYLYFSKIKNLSPEEKRMLDIFSNHAATAIQNALKYQSSQQTLKDMEYLKHIARSITATLDVNHVLEKILQAAHEIANTNICFLWYKNPATRKWARKFLPDLPDFDSRLPKIEEGEGIIGQVLKTGKPYMCQDTSVDQHYFPTWQETKSEIAIPIIIDKQVKGILNVESTRKDAFSERHIHLLTMLAEEAAIALQNAQLYEIANKKTQQVISLKEIGEALSQRRSIKEILKTIAQESLNIVGHGQKIASVMLIDREKNMLETKAIYGELINEDYEYFNIMLEEKSIVTWVANNNKPLIVPDVTREPRYISIFPQVRSEIAIPLCFRNEVVGVIDIESTRENAFDKQDIELLQTLADNTAIATKIGELCDIRLRQLEALQKTGTEISSSLDLEEVLSSVVKEGLSAIGPFKRTMYVQLLNNDSGTLEIKVAKGNGTLKYDYIGRKLNKDEGISGYVIRRKKYYLCPNVKKEPLYAEINPAVKSELCVPIIFKDEVIGLINVESLRLNDFGQHEIQLLEGLANQAGVAIENARLNEDLAQTQYDLSEALGITVISETLAGLTHDIRTASSLIAGEAQWVEFQLEQQGLNKVEIQDSMNKILEHVKRVENMTNALMERSHQPPLEYSYVKLVDIVKIAVHLMTRYARRHKIKIKCNYPSLQFSVQMDTGRIKRVFINLIKNAIEAMPTGGRLIIKAKRYEKYFKIFFADTGKGIEKEDLDRVWDPFFTLKEGGSGLGLSNCKRIIESDHNGEIKIKSTIGKGTTISIRLPYKQETFFTG